MQTTVNRTLNGVNVEQLLATINNVSENPALGASKFRLRNKWISGGHNRSSVQGFFAAGREDDTRAQPHLMEADEPAILVGTDKAPNPVEFVLHALAACLTTSIVYHAAARGIEIEELESQLEGDLDIRGFMGIGNGVRRGYKNVRATFTVKSDASVDQLKELAEFSPVFDTLRNPVAVTIDMRRK